MPKSIFICFFLLIYVSINAQVSIKIGGNYNNLVDDNILENKKPLFSTQIGGSIRLLPFKESSKFSIQAELLLQQKGYKQELNGEKYKLSLNYITIPLLLNFKPTNNFSIHGGFAFNHLINTNRKRGNDTYTQNDLAINFGMAAFENKKVSIYLRTSYGLIPIIDYTSIDKYGNFTNKINKFNNINFTIGAKLNIYEKKIKI